MSIVPAISVALLSILLSPLVSNCSVVPGEKPVRQTDKNNAEEKTEIEAMKRVETIQRAFQLSDQIVSSVDRKINGKNDDVRPSNAFALNAELFKELGLSKLSANGSNNSRFELKVESLKAQELSNNAARVYFHMEGATFESSPDSDKSFKLSIELKTASGSENYSIIEATADAIADLKVDLVALDKFYDDFTRHGNFKKRFDVRGRILVHYSPESFKVSAEEMKLNGKNSYLIVSEFRIEGSSIKKIEEIAVKAEYKTHNQDEFGSIDVEMDVQNSQIPVLLIDVEKGVVSVQN